MEGKRVKRALRLAVSTGLGITLLVGAGFCRADATESTLDQGKQKLQQGKAADAIKLLEKAVAAEPTNAEALLALGQAYKKAKDYNKAKTTLRSALRAARGSSVAAQANQELLSLPAKVVAPRASKRVVARVRGRRVAPAGLARVKLLAFTASWAQPCKQLQEDIDKAKAQWGEQVEVVAVDVDDPKNEQLLEQYDVSPVPTVVFLDQDGQMVSFLIGYSGIDTLNSKLKNLTSGGGKPSIPTG